MIENKPLYVAIAQRKEDRRARLQITFKFISLSNSLPKETLLLLKPLVSGTTSPSLPLLPSLSPRGLVLLEENSWDRKKWLRFSVMLPAKLHVDMELQQEGL